MTIEKNSNSLEKRSRKTIFRRNLRIPEKREDNDKYQPSFIFLVLALLPTVS